MISVLTLFLVSTQLLKKTMVVSQTNPNAPVDPKDQTEIASIFEQVDNAWNTHNMDAFSNLLTNDCQWVNVVGMWWNGKDAVKRAHVAFHKIMFHDVSLHTQQLSLRQIAPGVIGAIAVTHMGAYKTPDGSVIPEGDYRMSATLVARREGWRIDGAQVTPINPIAAKFDPGAPPKTH